MHSSHDEEEALFRNHYLTDIQLCNSCLSDVVFLKLKSQNG